MNEDTGTRDTNDGPSATNQISELALARLLLVGSTIFAVAFERFLASTRALDIDPMNLVYGMARFDVNQHAPHPPGYLLYVMTLRGLHALRGADSSLASRFATTQWLAIFFHLAAIVLTFVAVRRASPDRPLRAGFAGVLAAAHPFLVFHAIDAQTHTSEAFAGALLLLFLIGYVAQPTWRGALLLGFALALGAAFRPTFVVTGVLPIVWVAARRWRHLVAAGLTSIVGAALFVVPTLHASGGYHAFHVAHRALVEGLFFRSASLLSSEGVPAFQEAQLMATSSWLVLLVAPTVVTWILVRLLRRREDVKDMSEGARRIAVIATLAFVPTAIFYILVFCSEPGYLSGLVPFLVVASTMWPPDGWSLENLTRALVPGILVQLSILLSPATAPLGIKVPNLGTILARDFMADTWLATFERQVPSDGRLLVVSDFPDLTIARQVPMQVPRADMLSFYAIPRVVFRTTTAGFLTADAWLPIPGPAHLVTGPPTILDVPYAYDYVVVDLIASARTRDSVRETSTCPWPAGADDRFVTFPASCFPSRTIALDGQGVRFSAPRP